MKQLTKMIGSLTAKFAALLLTLGLFGNAWGANEAKIGTTEYATLYDAISAVGVDGTVVLLGDVTTSSAIQADKDFTLDLNNHKLTGTGDAVISVGTASLSVKDGTIIGDDYGIVSGSSSAVIALDNVTITAASAALDLYDYGGKVLAVGCSLTATDKKAAAIDAGGQFAEVSVEDSTVRVTNTRKTMAIDAGDNSTVSIIRSSVLGASKDDNEAVSVGTGTLTIMENCQVFGLLDGVAGHLLLKGGKYTDDPASYCADPSYIKETNTDATTLAAGYGFQIGGPYEAKIGTDYYSTLADAVIAAEASSTPVEITLLKSVELSSTINITKGMTINLSGNDIMATDARAIFVKSGDVTITGEGTISATKSESGTFDSSSSVIRVGDSAANTAKAKLTVGEDVTVASDHCYGITVFGVNDTDSNKATSDIELVLNGKVAVTGTASAISGNGTSTLSATTITIGSTAEVSATQDYAIYHPGKGTLTVNGSVTGKGGIEMKGGKVTINTGATVAATAQEQTHSAYNNGASTSGYAIAAVSNTSYAGEPTVTISGGTIVGKVIILADNDAANAGIITATNNEIAIDPDFKWVADGQGYKLVEIVYVAQRYIGETAGAKYESIQDAVDAAADNDTITLLGNVSYELTSTSKIGVTIDKTITLDGDGHKITFTGAYETVDKTYGIYVNSTAAIAPTIKNLTIAATGVERGIRFDGAVGGKVENVTITSDAVGIHVKGAGDVAINDSSVSTKPIYNDTQHYDAHLRSAVVLGSTAKVTLTRNTIVAQTQTSTDVLNYKAKGVYVGDQAKGTMILGSGNTITADIALAIDGSRVEANKNNLIVNAGNSVTGAWGSPSGQSYKLLEIKGGDYYDLTFPTPSNLGTMDHAKISITGGTFPVDVTTYCADGYVCLPSGTDRYVVGQAVACITSAGTTTIYTTFADAVAAANGEKVITLLADVGDYTLANGDTLIVNANGKTINVKAVEGSMVESSANGDIITYTAGVAVAKIGETTYTSLQKAVDAAYGMTGDVTIEMVSDTSGYSLVKQKAGLNLTIDGKNTTLKGQIMVDGMGHLTQTETLTIKNFVFKGTRDDVYTWIGKDKNGNDETRYADAFVFIPSTKDSYATITYDNSHYNYAHNVVITDCQFIETDSAKNMVAVKCPSQGAANISLLNSRAENVHSLVQMNSTTGVTIKNCTLINGKNGINVVGGGSGTVNNILIEGCKIDVALTPEDPSYGIRVKGGEAAVVTLSGDNTVKADEALAVEAANKTVTIQSGTYTGDVKVTNGSVIVPENSTAKVDGVLNAKDGGKIEISGGSFKDAKAGGDTAEIAEVEKYIADPEQFAAVIEDGWVVLKASKAVVIHTENDVTTTIGYVSFSEAAKKLVAGDVVKLLAATDAGYVLGAEGALSELKVMLNGFGFGEGFEVTATTGNFVVKSGPTNGVTTYSLDGAVAKIGDQYYATLQAAITAAEGESGNVDIVILRDIDAAHSITADWKLNNNTTFRSTQGETYSVAFNDKDVMARNNNTVIFDNSIKASGLAYPGTYGSGKVVFDGQANAYTLYIYNGEVEVTQNAILRPGDGQITAWGTTKMTVEGNLQSGQALTADSNTERQISGFYFCPLRGNHTFEFKNTFVASPWVSGNGTGTDTVTINLDNSVLYITHEGGEQFNMGTDAAGTVNLKNGSRIVVARANRPFTVNAKDTINIEAGSSITTGTWTNNGKVVVDMTGVTDDKLPLTVVTVTGADAPVAGAFEFDGGSYAAVVNKTAKTIDIIKVNANDGFTTTQEVLQGIYEDSGYTATQVSMVLDYNPTAAQDPANTYTVKPQAVSNGSPAKTVDLTNEQLVIPASGKIAVTLRVPTTIAGNDDIVKVTHTFTAGGSEVFNPTVADQKVTVEVTQFSTFTIEAAVAKIGDNYYTSLEEANAASQSGDTITLLQDAKLADRIWVKSGVTINGANRTIKADETSPNFNDERLITDSNYAASSSLTLINLAGNVTGVTIKNVTLDSNGVYPRALIGTGSGTTITLENVTLNHTSTTIRGADALALDGDCTIVGDFNVAMGERTWSAISFNEDGKKLNLTDGTSFSVTDDKRTGTQPVIIAYFPNGQVTGAENCGFVRVIGANVQTGYEPTTSAKVGNATTAGTVYNYKTTVGEAVTYYTTFSLAAAAAGTTGTVENFKNLDASDTYALTTANIPLKVIENNHSSKANLTVPEGYELLATTTEGVTTYTIGTAVATITTDAGTRYYASLQSAVDNAADGETIVVIAEQIELASRVDVAAEGKKIVVDLNGKTVKPVHTTGNGSAFNVVSGEFTIKNGTIDGTAVAEVAGGTSATQVGVNDGICLVTVRDGAMLNVTQDDGKTTYMVVNSKNGCCVYPFAGGAVNISGGTFENKTTEAYQYKEGFKGLTVNQGNGLGQLVNITGGTFKGNDPQMGDDSNGARFVAEGYVAMPVDGTTATQPGTYEVVEGGRVTFDTAGGTPVPAEQRIAKNGKVTKPADPAKEGFAFVNWYVEGATGSYNFNTKVTSDLILKAQWDEPVATITRDGVTLYYNEVTKALTAATDGDTVVLVKDFVKNFPGKAVATIGGNTIGGNKAVTLDLNGHRIENQSEKLYALSHNGKGMLTIVGPGTIKGQKGINAAAHSRLTIGNEVEVIGVDAGVNVAGGDTVVNVDGANIKATAADAAGVLVAGAGTSPDNKIVNVKSGTITGAYGIFNDRGTVTVTGGTISGTTVGIAIKGSQNLKSFLNVKGGTVSATGNAAAISGLGNADDGNYVITIDGGTVSSSDNAIYHCNNGELNIVSGTITGATAVYQKSGTLSISGGELVGNGEAAEYKYNGSGANSTGDALVVDNCNYPGGAPAVDIMGGTFTSTNGKGIGSYYGNGVAELATVKAKDNEITIHDDRIWLAQEEEGYLLVEAVVVTFSAGEGAANVPEPQKIAKGASAVEPKTVPTKANYVFDKWMLSDTAYDFNETVSENKTLTATWIEAVASVTTGDPAVTTYYSTLAAALAAANAGTTAAPATLTLLKDSTLTDADELDVTGAVTLDLNGKTLTNGANAFKSPHDYLIAVKRGGDLTVVDGVGGGAITSDDLCVAVKLTVKGEASTGDAAVLTIGSSAEGAANDFSIKGHDYGISGNGNRGGTVVTVNGGNISAVSEAAIYQPQDGTLTINGGALTGPAAVCVKVGTVNVVGGTLTGTAAAKDYEFYGNGVKPTGDALIVDSCNYPTGSSKPVVSITGGTFTSANGAGIGSYYGNGVTELASVTANSDTITIPDNETWVPGETAGTYKLVEAVFVTFNVDGGTPVPEQQKIQKGTTAVQPATAPTKAGFEFAGWTLDGAAYDFTAAVTADITLVAKWSEAVASVTKNDVTTYYATLQGAVNAGEGGTVTLLANVTLAARVDVAKSMTIDLGGKTVTATSTATNGSAFNITAGMVTIKNGTLDGQAVEETVDGNVKIANGICLVTVRSGATLNIPADTETEKTTMVVNSKNGCCVYPFAGGTVNIAGGTFENKTTAAYQYKEGFKGLTINQANVADQLVHLTGGTFKGNDPQLGDDNGARSVELGYVAMPAERTTATQPGTYTVVEGGVVTFDADGGAPVPAEQRVAATDTAVVPSTVPTKPQFVFADWTLNGTVYKFTDKVTTDITLTATWLRDLSQAKITKIDGKDVPDEGTISFEYDGEVHGTELTIIWSDGTSDGSVTVNEADYDITYMQDVATQTPEGKENVYVGTVTVTAKAKTNSTTYTGATSATFEITKRPISVKIPTITEVYNGTTQKFSTNPTEEEDVSGVDIETINETSFAEGDEELFTKVYSFTVEGKEVSGSPYSAVSGFNVGGETFMEDLALFNRNYSWDGKITTGGLVIEPREVTLTWTPDPATFVYNAAAQAPAAKAGNVVEGESLTVTVEGAQTVVGKNYTATATALVAGENTDVSNYKLPAEVTQTFAITPAKVELPTIASKTYTGAVQTAEVSASERYAVKANEGGKNVGEYDVVLGLTDAANYTWADETTADKTLKFAITPAAISVTVTGATETKSYTGSEIELTTFETAGLLNGHVLSGLTYSAKGTAVGPYTGVFAGAAVIKDGEDDVTQNYVVTTTAGTLTISAMSIEEAVVTLGEALTYNGTEQMQGIASVKVGDLTLTAGTDYTVSGDKGTAATTYTMTLTGTGNYTGTATKEFTIAKKAVAVTATVDPAKVAAGTQVTLGVEYEGFVIGEDKSVLTAQPTVTCEYPGKTAPGTYAVKASGAEAANYTFTYVPATLEVTGAVAKIGDVYYATLTDAMNAAGNGEEPTLIELVAPAEGTVITGEGIATWAATPKNVVIDFKGLTYDVTSPCVGSSGTQNQAAHLEKGSKVTFKNGTLTSATAAMLIQNYADLTLENFNADGTQIQGRYVASNNNGSLVVTGNSTITAKAGGVAFDVCATSYYPDGVTVTFDENFTGTVTGIVEYDVWGTKPAENKATLAINSANGKFNVTWNIEDALAEDAKANLNVNAGSFKEQVPADVCGPDLVPTTVADENGRYTVKPGYKVTFAKNDSEDSPAAQADGAEVTLETQTIAEGEKAKQPSELTRKGYTFNGWFADGVETAYDFDSEVKADIALAAKWKANQYTITFAETGDSTIEAITADYGTAVTAPADPVKTGYTFKGWDKAIPATVPAENVTITAQWAVNQYTITFAETGDSTIPAITADYGTAVTAPADPVKTGYTFKGWDKEIPATMPAENVTIKATWEINKYLVTFKNDDGSTITSAEVEYGATPEAPAATKDATAQYTYTFKAWEPAVAAVTGAATYTATYDATVNKYMIAFVVEGTTVQSGEVEYGQMPAFTGETPVKAATEQTTYTFTGWTPAIAAVTGNATYTAQFSEEGNVASVTIGGETNYYTSFADALAAAQAAEGATIALLDNVTLDAMFDVTKSMTIDLNGKTLARNDGNSVVQVANGATLTIDGTVEGSAVAGRINVGTASNNNGNVVLNGGAYTCAAGNTVLHVNGTCTDSDVTITGATIVSPDDNGIQLNGAGTHTITDSTIKGKTAVYVKAGEVTITGSTLESTAAEHSDYNYNGNGSNPTGDAIVVDSCAYPGGNPSVALGKGTTLNVVEGRGNAQVGYYEANTEKEGYESGVVKALSNELSVPEGYGWQETDTEGVYALAKVFTVTFNPDNGAEATEVEVFDGEKVSAPETAPVKEGYTFSAWLDEDGNAFDFANTAITADVTLKAQWLHNIVASMITTPEAAIYSGEAWTVTVKDGETVLVEGTHYTVKYDDDDNVNAGTVTATVTGIAAGGYAGEATVEFEIEARPLVLRGGSDTVTYDGETHDVNAYEIDTEAGMALVEADRALLESVVTGYLASGTNVGSYPGDFAFDYNAAGFQTLVSNYDLSTVSGMLTIERAKVNVAVGNAKKDYGEPDPANWDDVAVTVTGLVGSDTVEYTVSRQQGENVGTYELRATGAREQGNYVVTFEPPGVFTINAKKVTVTAVAASKTYGENDPALTATVKGLKEGDALTYTVKRAEGEDVTADGYAITVTGAETQGNYTVEYKGATFTINPAAVTVKADDKTKEYGDADPEFTATVSGLKNGDEPAVIAYNAPTCESGTALGTYPIAVTGDAAQGNYTVSYEGGTLTVVKAVLNVTADDIEWIVGNTRPELTATATRSNGDVVTGKVKYSLLSQGAYVTEAGEYPIVFLSATATDSNYEVVTQGGTYTVIPSVAKIGDAAYYATLEDAFKAAAASGDTIELLADVEVAETIKVEKDVGLNLGGFEIAADGVATVFEVGKTGALAIGGNGKVTGVANGQAFDGNALIMVDGGSLAIVDGTFTATGSGSDGMYGVYVLNGGTAVFGTAASGETAATGPTITSHFAAIGTNNTTAPAHITVNGGTYTANAAPTNDEWWSYFCAPVYAAAAGDYTLNGGTFNGYYGISSRYANVAQNVTLGNVTINATSGTQVFVDEKTGSAGESARAVKSVSEELTVPEDFTWVETEEEGVYLLTRQYTITFVDEDGETVLQSGKVAEGKTPEYTGETPAKEANAQYTYEFAGWTPEIAAVTGEATYKATYSETVNEYTITFVNEGGAELQSGKVKYGETPAYTGETPTKAATDEFTYTFAGWDKEIVSVTGEATYTATFDATTNEYTIKFVNDDGTELQSGKVKYGETPEYTGETPKKAATAQYTYTFDKWDGEIVAVTGDATYTATYTSTVNEYVVKFVNEDGTVLQSETLAYGVTPEYKGDMPAKEADEEKTYTFAGWDKEVASVTGETTYTATYTDAANVAAVTAGSVTKYYTTLAAAMADAKAAGTATVKMLADAEIAEGFVVDTAITLDMNGKTLTGSCIELFSVTSTGDLTITGIGTVNGPANGADFDGKSLITVDGGKLTVENGTFTATGFGSDGMYGVYVMNGGTATFGKEDGTGPAITSHFAAIGTNNTTAPATIVVNGGTYTANAAPTSNDWWSYFCAPVYAASAGEYTLNGGTFNGYYGISSRYVNVDQDVKLGNVTIMATSCTQVFVDEKTGSAGLSDRVVLSSSNERTIPEGYTWVVTKNGGEWELKKLYTITFVDEKGETIKTADFAKDTTAEKVAETVTKEDVTLPAGATGYTWTPAIEAVSSNATYTVSYVFGNGFVYPVGNGGVLIKTNWIQSNVNLDVSAAQPGSDEYTAAVTALSAKAPNGIPYWQNYVLGLTGAEGETLKIWGAAPETVEKTGVATGNYVIFGDLDVPDGWKAEDLKVGKDYAKPGYKVGAYYKLMVRNADGTLTDVNGFTPVAVTTAEPELVVPMDDVANQTLVLVIQITVDKAE